MVLMHDLLNNKRMKTPILTDRFGRKIDYLRLSVTDRCDFRCIYCMAEDMTFLPKKEVLTLEEMTLVARVFVSLGVEKIRITGGEPLIRKNVISLFRSLGKLTNLKELCVTTNGSHLSQYGSELVKAGVDRINISLDTLNSLKFKKLTRFGKLNDVLKGIESAKEAGFKRIKINSVLMQNYNLDEASNLARFAMDNGLDISFIEEMPLGEIKSHSRNAEFISSDNLREELGKTLDLKPDTYETGGPSRYWSVKGYENKIGFISPHSDNFCASCNRVRVTASGRLLLCLGNEHSLDLRKIIRDSNQQKAELESLLASAIINAMQNKPEKHEFSLDDKPQIVRFMNATGG